MARARHRVRVWALISGLIPFALAFIVYLLVYLEMRPGATGDEPHYLVTAQSIAYDLDLDLRNDYASRKRVLRVVNVFPLGPHAAVYKESGELRPFRGIGLPMLVAPGVGLGGLTGARLVMVLIAALLADQLYRLLRDLRLRRPYRIAAWAAVVFCLPVLPFSSQFYPELPGALLVVVALRVIVSGRSPPTAVALASAAAAALPWLHMRYLPLSFGILLGLAVAACWDRPGTGRSESDRGAGLRVRQAGSIVARCFGVAKTRWRTVTLPLLLPFVIGVGLLAAAFQYWYGTFDPQAGYHGFYGSNTVGSGGWDFWYEFALRDILDPVVGWIPFAPAHWVGFAALGCAVIWFGWPAAATVAVAAGYELLVASVGPNVGWGLPGRYPMIIIPLIAIPLAVGIQGLRVARVVFVPLLMISFVFAVAAVRDHGGLYPIAETQRIFGLRSIATAFPVVNQPERPKGFTLAPGDFPPETGEVRAGMVVATAPSARPGFMLWGPYSALKRGAYEVTFRLAAAGVRPDDQVATVEVVGGQDVGVLAQEVVTARQLRPWLSEIRFAFASPGVPGVEARVYYHGRGTLRAGPVAVEPVAPATASSHFRDWPLAFLWVGGTALIGSLFVQVMRLGWRRPS